MNERPKMVAKATQTIEDAFPTCGTDLLLSHILDEITRTNALLENIQKLLEETPLDS